MPSKRPIAYLAVGLAAGALLPGMAKLATDSPSAETYRQLDTLMDVFEKVRSDYVEKVDDKKLIEGAINGMLTSLDPHSGYLNAKDFAQLRNVTDGEYGGLGLSVTTDDGAVKVIAPMDGTPAARAGMKAGDYITHLDGELIYGLTLSEAVDKMRGAPGSKVKLTVVRDGATKPLEFTMQREVIEIHPVKSEVKGNVGIIRIASFSKTTAADTRAAIAKIKKQLGASVTGYVIDLRSDPGGLLDQAVDTADIFLERGEIVSQRGRGRNQIERYYAKPGDETDGKPIVVLVDEGSASAAEIVAGALQDQRRALVMGQRSFGKGSVQSVIQLGPDSALRLTTARYFTPSGRSVQEGGIEPDVVVPQLSDADLANRTRVRESDLRRHLINELKLDEKKIEDDGKPDPRFTQTAADLKKAGVTDFQMDYAVKTIARLAPAPMPQTRIATAG
jgi:carboxyl-terminal processing protease